MAKPFILIQLVSGGQPAWVVREEVDQAVCRKMSKKELDQLGEQVVAALTAVVGIPAPAAVEPPKKSKR